MKVKRTIHEVECRRGDAPAGSDPITALVEIVEGATNGFSVTVTVGNYPATEVIPNASSASRKTAKEAVVAYGKNVMECELL